MMYTVLTNLTSTAIMIYIVIERPIPREVIK